MPLASPQSIDAVMYADAGMRATVAVGQPKAVGYDKFPYCKELPPPALRREMMDAPRQRMDELLALYEHLLARRARPIGACPQPLRARRRSA